MDAKTYIGHIDQIKGSPEELHAEESRLTQRIDALCQRIESGLNDKNIPTLLTSLGVQELSRRRSTG